MLSSQVLDEADRILNMDFEQELDKLLKVIPRERRTFLFSATMTKKVSCQRLRTGTAFLICAFNAIRLHFYPGSKIATSVVERTR